MRSVRKLFSKPESFPDDLVCGTDRIIQFERDTEGKPIVTFDHDVLATALRGCEKKPVLVICVTGEFRSGKSFLLNLLVTFLNHLSKVSHNDGMDVEKVFCVEWTFEGAVMQEYFWNWSFRIINM